MPQARLHSSRLKLATCCLLGVFLATPLAQANQDATNQATNGSSPVKTIALINPNSNTESTRSMADLARLETRGSQKWWREPTGTPHPCSRHPRI